MGHLHLFDLLIVGGYMVLTVLIGLAFTRHGSKNTDNYFLSGRSLVWWVAGLSMVATNFASDTPLWVTSLVRKYGLHAVWQYWAMMIGAALSAVLFCRLWRRLGVTTDIEFLELRYSGKPAATLRGWNGAFHALIMCPMTIAWVTKAMATISRETFGLAAEEEWIALAVILLFSIGICMMSGLDGVAYTGVIIFVFCLLAGIMVAVFALREVGGIDGLMSGLNEKAVWPVGNLSIVPQFGSGPGQMSVLNGIGYFLLFWIGTAYGGAYIAQRMMACRDSRHAGLGQLTATVIYFGVLAWPWILVALCSILLIGNIGDASADDGAYVAVAMKVLPIGLKGVFVASMIAAFMSTITALYNWGSSYIVNDLYRRFLVRKGSPKHYVRAGRAATVLLAVLGGYASSRADDIQQLLSIGYAIGGSQFFILMMRWFWPRLTAWGEMAGLAAGAVFGTLMLSGVLNRPLNILFRLAEGTEFHKDYEALGARILFMLVAATLAAVVVSLLGPRTPQASLEAFVHKARPFRIFWRKTVPAAPESLETIPGTLLSWGLIIGSLLLLLSGIKDMLFGRPWVGIAELVLCAGGLWWVVRRLNRDYLHELKSGPQGTDEDA
jgi:solute:Na+ symporter, SSS family